jgi:hypothetical protein
MSPDAALPDSLCRLMSLSVGDHWGTYWGSRCFRKLSFLLKVADRRPYT